MYLLNILFQMKSPFALVVDCILLGKHFMKFWNVSLISHKSISDIRHLFCAWRHVQVQPKYSDWGKGYVQTTKFVLPQTW